jgi:hypothetical protein
MRALGTYTRPIWLSFPAGYAGSPSAEGFMRPYPECHVQMARSRDPFGINP